MIQKREEIEIRDPFILPLKDEKQYYMFGTTNGLPRGFHCWKSTDLENWEGPILAFDPPPELAGAEDFWAPEVHCYNQAYYMFVTIKAQNRRRGCMILRAARPEGPYQVHSDGFITPADWECLDGTLYVEEGKPYLIFCHEWVQIHDGTICYCELDSELRHFAGEIREITSASAAPWTVSLDEKHTQYVTDGPFLFQKDGFLYMLWSSFATTGYAMGLLVSEKGIHGPWRHLPEPLIASDGGHGMRFQAFDGEDWLVVHRPNASPLERAIFFKK